MKFIANDHLKHCYHRYTRTFSSCIIPGWEWKRLKGCIFSPPFLLPVLGGPKEARKCNLSIASIPVCLNLFYCSTASDLSRVFSCDTKSAPPQRKSYSTKFAPLPLQLLFSVHSREGTSFPPAGGRRRRRRNLPISLIGHTHTPISPLSSFA